MNTWRARPFSTWVPNHENYKSPPEWNFRQPQGLANLPRHTAQFCGGFLRPNHPRQNRLRRLLHRAPLSNSPKEDLNRLLAPIALYPDALVALILPASTVPPTWYAAARYISSNGDPAQVATHGMTVSSQLMRYPEVLKWMDQNLEWATTVGEAFDQPADVMNSIQRLRAEAVAAGNLTDTPQQHVVKEKSCVRIVPAATRSDLCAAIRSGCRLRAALFCRMSVPFSHLGWDSPLDPGSTTIAIGTAAVFMWASGGKDGTMTEIGMAGAGIKAETGIAETEARATTSSMS